MTSKRDDTSASPDKTRTSRRYSSKLQALSASQLQAELDDNIAQAFSQSDIDILESAFEQFDERKNGTIDARALRSLLESLDFCLDDEIITTLVESPPQDANGMLTWKDFLTISRQRVQLEADLCRKLFQNCDDDEDGLLQPCEVMRMVSKLGVSLLPETLADVTEECQINGEAIDFESFWKILQVLREREGFTSREAAEIREVFAKYDSGGQGEMPLKRVPTAMAWLGYQPGPGVIGKANKQVEIPSMGSEHPYITEAQFMKLARKHREAELKAIRKVYRTFAHDGGAGKLFLQELQAAVTRLNRLFVNDVKDWMKAFRPCTKVPRKHISFDFEEFRLIVFHCSEKMRTRIRKNCGYSDAQLSHLRNEFVKYTNDGSSTELDATGVVKLVKALFPQANTSSKVRNRLKTAFEDNSATDTGLDWHSFLRVMRAYDNLAEEDAEHDIQAGLDELNLPDECLDKAQEILSHLLEGTKSRTPTPSEIVFLVQSVAPGLTEYEAEEALLRLHEAMANHEDIEGEINVVVHLKRIIRDDDLSRRTVDERPDM